MQSNKNVGDAELARFYTGDRDALAALYNEHFETVDLAVGRVLSGPDRETVVHEVFFRLFSSEELRRRFVGGSLAAWLTTMAHNQAIDHRRRRAREAPLSEMPEPQTAFEEQLHARLLIQKFRADVLPLKWESVFAARFLEGLSQREAAERIGISRTTLVYQELRIQLLLNRFLLGEDRA